jgi:CRP-like cAMP-binding protein
VPTAEHTGAQAGRVARGSYSRLAAGAAVFEQGDAGDDFYVIEHGQAEVVGDGTTVRTLGPGDGFGEIALLRRCARTTTVRAVTPWRRSLRRWLDTRRAPGRRTP